MKHIKLIMGFDFGMKHIGIAIGQQLTYTAQPITTLKSTTIGTQNWNKIIEIFNMWKPKVLVVGLPINVNGTEQKLTLSTRKFSKKLKKQFNCKVIMHDERFSTIEARYILFKHSGYNALQSYKINSISAALILESWLQQNKYINT